MKYVLCGPAVPAEMENYMSDFSPAAGKFLRRLKDGLEENGCRVIVAAYITNAILKQYAGRINEIVEGSSDVLVFKGKNIANTVRTYQKRVFSLIDPNTVVLFYNMSYAYYGMQKKIQRYGGVSCLLFADHTEAKEFRSFPRKMMTWTAESEIRKFAYSIILTKKLQKKLNRNCKSLLIQGGVFTEEFKDFELTKQNQKTVFMYAGLLSYVTGVDALLQMIAACKRSDVEFWISGKGALRNEVRAAAEQDERIKFLGFLNEREYSGRLQEAHAFINPRNMALPQNQNNFPSKTLEYLATGKVVISTEFAGYEQFIENFLFYDGSKQAFLKLVDEVAEKYDQISGDFYCRNRKRSLEFDWTRQAKKIMNFCAEYSIPQYG
jgi:Glycosyltransferase